MKKIIPNKLKKGDTIQVIAPSNSVQEEDIKFLKETEKLFNSRGIKVIYGKYASSDTLGYGATPKEKAVDIDLAFLNKDVQAIFCAKGGENSNTLFDYIDYELIKKNPKIFCGFSDSTSLLNMINQKTGLITFHASTFKAISDWDDSSVFEDIIDKLMKGKNTLQKQGEKFTIIQKGICEGELIGGNLSCLSRMVCGRYSLDFNNKIMFIEDLAEESDPKLVSSFLYYMKQNDVFSKINGMWIGSYQHESKISLEKIVKDVIEDEYNIPIIKSNNFGHIEKKITIPIGIKAKIDTSKNKKIILLEEHIN